MAQPQRLVVLISGRGSNMEALLQAAQRRRWAARWGAQVVAVLSNRPQAQGLQVAAQHGVATAVVDHQAYPSREAFDAALAQAIDAHQPTLVLLAGFMRVLGAGFVARYQGRLLNIHPSLLPAFAGLNTHARALQAGCEVAGATVHWVDEGLDSGAIVAQAVVPVLPADTPETLGQRVLAAEHRLYPRAVERLLAAGL
ncbi:MAG: phosphoribosylglycinamide formyltransferase [Proteobacteria bacterium]|nr:phosphoribosylglycinamide formyltransferase [Pseudomonadota bacterium]MDA0869414.1 phosphoribosylglycinamide formyltransferase [Pseudomonadota bacterium]MDA1327738.1 phosphoribosylglycinamide formyltransferase [Pseudomonadota bacterium]